MASASLAVSLIGKALAHQNNKLTKQCVKQADRLLSNLTFDLNSYFCYWVPRIIGQRETAEVTQQGYLIPIVVYVKDKAMKEPWVIASNCPHLKTREIINLYSKRWAIETKFRDQKNIRLGMGLFLVLLLISC